MICDKMEISLLTSILLKSVYSGLVAQLARALLSHSRGQGFDSPQVHKEEDFVIDYVALPLIFLIKFF